MDENKFLELAEYALEDIIDWIDGIEEMLDETDISLSVCTISNS
jgi:frataxin-like iron-binding protein CyaY